MNGLVLPVCPKMNLFAYADAAAHIAALERTVRFFVYLAWWAGSGFLVWCRAFVGSHRLLAG